MNQIALTMDEQNISVEEGKTLLEVARDNGKDVPTICYPDATTANRLYLLTLDPATGRLTLDERFRGAGDSLPGVSMAGRSWPHGFAGTAVPHGTVFSR